MNKFNWGPHMANENNQMRKLLSKEFFSEDVNIYQKYFKVQKNDVVMDLGASIGPFTYNILPQRPKLVYCVEASKEQLPTLLKNTDYYQNCITINKAIHSKDENVFMQQVYGEADNNNDVPTFTTPKLVEGIRFETLVKEYNINQIDFLKTDCEGGEYDVFNFENRWWIRDNVRYIAGEFHLSSPELKEKFRKFRDSYLKIFSNFKVEAVCGTDIKWDLWNESFIQKYNEVIIYIDNKLK